MVHQKKGIAGRTSTVVVATPIDDAAEVTTTLSCLERRAQRSGSTLIFGWSEPSRPEHYHELPSPVASSAEHDD